MLMSVIEACKWILFMDEVGTFFFLLLLLPFAYNNDENKSEKLLTSFFLSCYVFLLHSIAKSLALALYRYYKHKGFREGILRKQNVYVSWNSDNKKQILMTGFWSMYRVAPPRSRDEVYSRIVRLREMEMVRAFTTRLPVSYSFICYATLLLLVTLCYLHMNSLSGRVPWNTLPNRESGIVLLLLLRGEWTPICFWSNSDKTVQTDVTRISIGFESGFSIL